MTKEEAINLLKQVNEILINSNSWLENTHEPLNQAFDMAIKSLEIVEEFEKAQIITGGRLNGRTYAYKCGLEDGKRKALEQQLTLLDKVKQAREEIEEYVYCDKYDCINEDMTNWICASEAVEILDNLIEESEGKE